MRLEIKVLRQDNNVTLVNYKDKAVIIPVSVVDDNFTVDEVDLEAGIEYGVNWADAFSEDGIGARIASELYRVGLFTAQDVLSRPNAVQGAIQSAYGVDMARVLDYARKIARGQVNG